MIDWSNKLSIDRSDWFDWSIDCRPRAITRTMKKATVTWRQSNRWATTTPFIYYVKSVLRKRWSDYCNNCSFIPTVVLTYTLQKYKYLHEHIHSKNLQYFPNQNAFIICVLAIRISNTINLFPYYSSQPGIFAKKSISCDKYLDDL